jgi:hypothetical protein
MAWMIMAAQAATRGGGFVTRQRLTCCERAWSWHFECHHRPMSQEAWRLSNAVGPKGTTPPDMRVARIAAEQNTFVSSVAKDVLLDLVHQAGLPRPEVNPPLQLGGTTLLPDLLWREHKLVVEIDGAQFHASRHASEDDARKRAILEAHGYRVLRIGYAQLTQQPEQTVARLTRAGDGAAPAQARGRYAPKTSFIALQTSPIEQRSFNARRIGCMRLSVPAAA